MLERKRIIPPIYLKKIQCTQHTQAFLGLRKLKKRVAKKIWPFPIYVTHTEQNISQKEQEIILRIREKEWDENDSYRKRRDMREDGQLHT